MKCVTNFNNYVYFLTVNKDNHESLRISTDFLYSLFLNSHMTNPANK